MTFSFLDHIKCRPYAPCNFLIGFAASQQIASNFSPLFPDSKEDEGTENGNIREEFVDILHRWVGFCDHPKRVESEMLSLFTKLRYSENQTRGQLIAVSINDLSSPLRYFLIFCPFSFLFFIYKCSYSFPLKL
jgi:hypothetical protein